MLRAAAAKSEANARMTTEHPPAQQRAACAALVVDDSGVERLLAIAALQKLGFAAAGAASAEAALEMMAMQMSERQRYDLVLCDVSLPGMDGLELLSALRSADAGLCCIMLSNHDDARYAQLAAQRGALAYLVKPLRLSMLRELLWRRFACVAQRAPGFLERGPPP